MGIYISNKILLDIFKSRIHNVIMDKTDLTEEEKAIIAAGEKEYEENPESFVNWDDVYNEYRSNKAAE
jgi:hypothetical protein